MDAFDRLTDSEGYAETEADTPFDRLLRESSPEPAPKSPAAPLAPAAPVLSPAQVKGHETFEKALNYYREAGDKAFPKSHPDFWTKSIPFGGTAYQIASATHLYNASNRIQEDKGTDSDWWKLAREIARSEHVKGQSLPDKISEGFVEAPGFLGELYLTGGVGKLAGETAKRAALRYVKNKLALTATEYAARAAAQTAVMPGMYVPGGIGRNTEAVRQGEDRALLSPQGIAPAYGKAATTMLALEGAGGAAGKLIPGSSLRPAAGRVGAQAAVGATGVADIPAGLLGLDTGYGPLVDYVRADTPEKKRDALHRAVTNAVQFGLFGSYHEVARYMSEAHAGGATRQQAAEGIEGLHGFQGPEAGKEAPGPTPGPEAPSGGSESPGEGQGGLPPHVPPELFRSFLGAFVHMRRQGLSPGAAGRHIRDYLWPLHQRLDTGMSNVEARAAYEGHEKGPLRDFGLAMADHLYPEKPGASPAPEQSAEATPEAQRQAGTVRPSADSRGQYDLMAGDKTLGSIGLGEHIKRGANDHPLGEAYKAEFDFPGLTKPGETVARIHGIEVNDPHKGAGLGQRLYLEGMLKHGADWYYNTQTYPGATNALKALQTKGLIELHWQPTRDGPEPAWGQKGGSHLVRLTEAGRKAAGASPEPPGSPPAAPLAPEPSQAPEAAPAGRQGPLSGLRQAIGGGGFPAQDALYVETGNGTRLQVQELPIGRMNGDEIALADRSRLDSNAVQRVVHGPSGKVLWEREAAPQAAPEAVPADVVAKRQGMVGGEHVFRGQVETARLSREENWSGDPAHDASFPEPHATEAGIAEGSGREALPVPEGGEQAGPSFASAWEAVSRLWPEMAQKVKKVKVIPGVEGQPRARAGADRHGTLLVVAGSEVRPGDLWHELVHFSQERPAHKDRTQEQHNQIEKEATVRAAQMERAGAWSKLAPQPSPEVKAQRLADLRTIAGVLKLNTTGEEAELFRRIKDSGGQGLLDSLAEGGKPVSPVIQPEPPEPVRPEEPPEPGFAEPPAAPQTAAERLRAGGKVTGAPKPPPLRQPGTRGMSEEPALPEAETEGPKLTPAQEYAKARKKTGDSFEVIASDPEFQRLARREKRGLTGMSVKNLLDKLQKQQGTEESFHEVMKNEALERIATGQPHEPSDLGANPEDALAALHQSKQQEGNFARKYDALEAKLIRSIEAAKKAGTTVEPEELAGMTRELERLRASSEGKKVELDLEGVQDARRLLQDKYDQEVDNARTRGRRIRPDREAWYGGKFARLDQVEARLSQGAGGAAAESAPGADQPPAPEEGPASTPAGGPESTRLTPVEVARRGRVEKKYGPFFQGVDTAGLDKDQLHRAQQDILKQMKAGDRDYNDTRALVRKALKAQGVSDRTISQAGDPNGVPGLDDVLENVVGAERVQVHADRPGQKPEDTLLHMIQGKERQSSEEAAYNEAKARMVHELEREAERVRQKALQSGYRATAVAEAVPSAQEAGGGEADTGHAGESGRAETGDASFDFGAPERPGDVTLYSFPANFAAYGAKLADAFKRFLAPASRGPEARTGAGAIREPLAVMAHKREIARTALDGAVRFFDKHIAALSDQVLRKDAFLHVTDALEGGTIANLAPGLREFAQTMRDLIDERTAALQSRGMLHEFIEDYMGHLWKKPGSTMTPDDIAQMLAGRRPLAGSEGYKRQRKLPTWRDGIDAGLEPVDWNPARLTLLKLGEVDKSIMAHDARQELGRLGMRPFVRLGAAPPQGWVFTADKADTVYKPREPGEAGPALVGHYYQPEPVARLLTNHLSPGLRGNALYDAAMGFSNSLNLFQLGFGAFHAGFVIADTQVSAAALAMQKLSGLRTKGLARDIASAVFPGVSLGRALSQGSKLMQEYYEPGSQGAEFTDLVKALEEGGGRARMEGFNDNTYLDGFRKAIAQVQATRGRQGVPSALLQALPALAEFTSKPVMEGLVPRVKFGVFADMARDVLDQLGSQATPEQRREALGQAWDSVDNRMGQLAYDNLFWNRTVKDLFHLLVRSVGWNTGTIREVVGGFMNLPKDIASTIAGKGAGPKLAYVLGLAGVSALYGALWQYLRTGKGPEEPKDYYFPKNGRTNKDGTPGRDSPPTYIRDIQHLTNRADEGPLRLIENAGEMAKGKLNPGIVTFWEMVSNDSFYGAVRNPEDPVVQQAQDSAEHLLRAYEPFSFRAYRKTREEGASHLESAAGLVGVTPAPARVTRSWEEQRDVEEKRRFIMSPLEKHRREEGSPIPRRYGGRGPVGR